jgi:hypothetical protein
VHVNYLWIPNNLYIFKPSNLWIPIPMESITVDNFYQKKKKKKKITVDNAKIAATRLTDDLCNFKNLINK